MQEVADKTNSEIVQAGPFLLQKLPVFLGLNWNQYGCQSNPIHFHKRVIFIL